MDLSAPNVHGVERQCTLPADLESLNEQSHCLAVDGAKKRLLWTCIRHPGMLNTVVYSNFDTMPKLLAGPGPLTQGAFGIVERGSECWYQIGKGYRSEK